MNGYTPGRAPPVLASHHSVAWGPDFVRIAFGDQHGAGAEIIWHTQIFMTRHAADLLLKTIDQLKAQLEAQTARKN